MDYWQIANKPIPIKRAVDEKCNNSHFVLHICRKFGSPVVLNLDLNVLLFYIACLVSVKWPKINLTSVTYIHLQISQSWAWLLLERTFPFIHRLCWTDECWLECNWTRGRRYWFLCTAWGVSWRIFRGVTAGLRSQLSTDKWCYCRKWIMAEESPCNMSALRDTNQTTLRQIV